MSSETSDDENFLSRTDLSPESERFRQESYAALEQIEKTTGPLTRSRGKILGKIEDVWRESDAALQNIRNEQSQQRREIERVIELNKLPMEDPFESNRQYGTTLQDELTTGGGGGLSQPFPPENHSVFSHRCSSSVSPGATSSILRHHLLQQFFNPKAPQRLLHRVNLLQCYRLATHTYNINKQATLF